MKGSLLSLTLRELQRDMQRRQVVVGVLGAGVILGISGPFDTLRVLPLVPRLLYWVFLAFAAFGIGSFISIATEKGLRGRSAVLRAIVSIAGISIAVSLFLIGLNALLFGIWPGTIKDAIALAAIVMAISAVIEIGSQFLKEAPQDATSDILARLPLDKRGPLVSMTATDHYVEVVTTNGSALILMRLADAIKEAGTEGLQVHRSHWIASAQVSAARREANRVILTMSHGAEIPVSRSYLPAVKAAGFLPKSRMDAS